MRVHSVIYTTVIAINMECMKKLIIFGINTQHQLPFDGKIDWETVMKKIAEIGYLGSTALEPMYWDYTDLTAEEFLQKGFERARQLEMLRFNNSKSNSQ